MIDIHCHILPKVDDGSKDLEESLAMARIAQREGIKTIVNTSHFHPDFEYTMGTELIDELESFKEQLQKNNIDIDVVLGNELYYSDNLLEFIEQGDFHTINDSKYLLIEFSPSKLPNNFIDVIYELKIRGYVPIIAHVERYSDVQEDINIICDAINEGALIQVNASSIVGKASLKVNETTDSLLRNNMVHLVGTDAHGSGRRRPLMKEAFDIVCEEYGETKANALFIHNSNKVINNEEIYVKPVKIEVKKKKGIFAKLFNR